MSGGRVLDILIGAGIVVGTVFFMWLLLFVIFPPRVNFQTTVSTTFTIPTTEWKCEINAEKEIICKGVMK